MNLRTVGATLAAAFALSACSGGGGSAAPGEAALETDDQKASYGIGLNMGAQLEPAESRIDRAALLRGIEDAMQGREPAVPAGELQQIMNTFGQEVERAMAAERDAAAQENAIAGEAFMAENARSEGVTTTTSGLQYEVLREGEGERPRRDQSVRVHYRGTLIDGTEFDSSYGGDPVTFPVNGLIPGFTEALLMMPEGSQYRVAIPSDLAYGPMGSGDIGPNETLIFEIELVEIVDDG